MHLPSVLASFLALTLPGIISCGSSDLTLPGTPGAPASITVVTGDGQEAPAGTPLRDPLVVKVTDAEGDAVPAQQVVFAPDGEASGAVLTPDATTTGPGGTAETRWVLGDRGGTQQALARVSSEATAALEVRFTASALVHPRGADHLALPREPSGSATAGVRLARQPVVRIQDAAGTAISRSGVPVTAAVAAGNGVLSGTRTELTDRDGRAEFTNLMIVGARGAHILIFAANGYASVTSSVIEVQAAPSNGGGGGDDDDGDDDGGRGGEDDDRDDDDDDRDGDDDRDRDREKGSGKDRGGKGKGDKGGGSGRG